jgi:phage baseplate assembly protein W
MNLTLYRAWRFSHPDLEPAETAGLRISNHGGPEMVEGRASVQQALRLLLSTRPGERVMRPHYGCDLHRLAFLPNDNTTAGLAIHYVRQAIQRWEPRVEIVRLEANGPSAQVSPGLLEIYLEYRVRATQQTDRLTYAFDLTGEKT